MALAPEMRLEGRERLQIFRALTNMGRRADVIHGTSGNHCKVSSTASKPFDLASLMCDEYPGCCVESGLEASNWQDHYRNKRCY